MDLVKGLVKSARQSRQLGWPGNAIYLMERAREVWDASLLADMPRPCSEEEMRELEVERIRSFKAMAEYSRWDNKPLVAERWMSEAQSFWREDLGIAWPDFQARKGESVTN